MNIIKQIFLPNNINFGADIKNITFTDNYVIKEFKTFEKFRKTMMFYDIITINDSFMFPKLIEYNANKHIIKTENCGILLNIYNLPEDWENQFINLKNFFIKNKIMILDLRFMSHSPYIINNMCIKNNKIYLVDLVLWEKMSKKNIDHIFLKLIKQIKLYNYYKNSYMLLIIFHIYFEFIRYLIDIIRKIKLLFVWY